MLQAHYPLLLTFVLACGLGGALLFLSSLLGPRRPSEVKSDPFECGNPPTGPALNRFNVKFYLVAILFLVFDIEAVFIYPWAVNFAELVRSGGDAGRVAVLDMTLFVAIILVGLTYAWRKGALAWSHHDAYGARGPTTAMAAGAAEPALTAAAAHDFLAPHAATLKEPT